MDESQIDWDVGMIEEQVEESEDLGTDGIIESNLGDNLSDKVKGINWDVGIEDLTVEMEAPVESSSCGELVDGLIETGANGLEERSQLLETEYRNKILDDLFEVFIYFLCWGGGLLSFCLPRSSFRF